MKKILLVLLCLGIVGCATASIPDRQILSSGQIGCPPNEIQITDNRGIGEFPKSWTAQCKGKIYYCSLAAPDTKASCIEAKK
jgi:hypothetical protein